jgi:hypothetical protein
VAYWRLLDGDGGERGRSEDFEDRDDAEVWLSTEWSSLAADGVSEVALVEGDDEVYRMSLSDPDD